MTRGVFGLNVFAAHRGGGLRLNALWSGHRGPPPAALVLASRGAMCVWGVLGRLRPQRVLCPLVRGSSVGCPMERTQRSAPPRRWFWALSARCSYGRGLEFPALICSLPNGAGVFGWMPSGADAEVRAPAALVLVPFRGQSVSERIGGSSPRGVCAFGREMSVDGGRCGPVALGPTG